MAELLFGRMIKGKSAHDMGMHTQMYLGLTGSEAIWLRRRMRPGRPFVVYYREALSDVVVDVHRDPVSGASQLEIGGDGWFINPAYLDDLTYALAHVLGEQDAS